jgi:hypothetical protein
MSPDRQASVLYFGLESIAALYPDTSITFKSLAQTSVILRISWGQNGWP